MYNKIKDLKIDAWRQYDNIDIKFHDRLTIITGANGAGKTTIINIINQHFGWNSQLVGTPKKDIRTGVISFFSDIWASINNRNRQYESVLPYHIQQGNNVIGEIKYSNGIASNLFVPSAIGNIYQVSIASQQVTRGINIPSHRPVYKYQAVANISTRAITKQDAYNTYHNAKYQRYYGGHVAQSETYFIKEALISLATFGYGNQVVSRNEESVRVFEGFENILRQVLPPKIGFKSISVRIPEIVLVTSSGEFTLDAVSGGIASIIDLAWQIYMFDDGINDFIVTFDEPENHLHPEMQKTILPNFLKAFPKAQFIVASHNPFIISSVPDSLVYALKYNIENKVVSVPLSDIDKSGTANEILREVLGIETTLPDWVDDAIDKLIDRYSNSGITPENVVNFKNDLRQAGLEKFSSASVVSLVEKSKQNDKNI